MSYEALVEPQNPAGNLDQLEQNLKTATAVTQVQAADPAKETSGATERPDWIEEKFWTGDIQESAQKMAEGYKNLQSAYGRMANDLGTQRQLTDRLLDVKRESDLNRNAPEPVEIDGAALIDRPNETLDDFLKPRLEETQQALNQRLDQIESVLGQNSFTAKHPDYNEIGNDPQFVQWVNASAYRTRVANQALQGDWAAADEIISEFKAVRQASQTATSTTDPAAQALDEARKVGLETSASAGSGQQGSKQEYRRADLIRLKIEKPHIYEDPSFQREIMAAYAEGRVK